MESQFLDPGTPRGPLLGHPALAVLVQLLVTMAIIRRCGAQCSSLECWAFELWRHGVGVLRDGESSGGGVEGEQDEGQVDICCPYFLRLPGLGGHDWDPEICSLSHGLLKMCQSM